MLKNIVLLNWKEALTDEQQQTLTTALKALPSQISQIKSMSFGTDKKMIKGNADFVMMTEFDSEADFKAYLVHPDHQALSEKIVGPLMAKIRAIQFEE